MITSMKSIWSKCPLSTYLNSVAKCSQSVFYYVALTLELIDSIPSRREMERFLLMILCATLVSGKSLSSTKWANDEEIEIYRQYLRIPTVQPNVDYQPAVAFLKQQAETIDLPVNIFYPVDKNNPVVVITWEGSQPKLPSIMFNSHMDVVPVYEEYWTHPPFAAEMDENGDIYARGAQDTKAVGMQYLAAIRALKRQGVKQLKRTVHVVYVPDEEVGGTRGMGGFVKSEAFNAMNVGFVMDEGGPSINEILPAFYVERSMWDVELTFHGHSGHGSILYENTPGEKLDYVLGKLMEFRKEEFKKVKEQNIPMGNVTTINLTMLKGGVESNVIPAELSATFDIRISADSDVEDFERQINLWCKEAGGNITIRTLIRSLKEVPTRVDSSNPFWVALESAVTETGLKVEPIILYGSTDMTYMRNLNISAIGFAPMINTEIRVHDHNEYLNADTYLKGIEVYQKIIPNLANV